MDGFDSLARFIELEFWIVICGLAAVIFYKMLSGGINMDGLLCNKSGRGAEWDASVSPERVQLLVFSLIAALVYVSEVVGSPDRFPALPDALLLLLGASNFAYLGGKAYTMMFKGEAA